MQTELSFYARQGILSDPGEFRSLYADLPTRLDELVKVVQTNTIHIFWAERYGLKLPDGRMEEVQLRAMARRLARAQELDPRPLTQARSLETKLVGNCRDFSLLLVSLLRHQGIPARARCGFGAYFLPDHFEDHWVAEVWDTGREAWVLVDAQLDEFQQEALDIPFDPLDVPRDQFIVAGQAWQMCRSGENDPDRFGIFDMHGLWFVRGNLLRDLAALNKVELLPWDCWGMMLNETAEEPAQLACLDEVAAITGLSQPDWQVFREVYEHNPDLKMQGNLLSAVNGEMRPVSVF